VNNPPAAMTESYFNCFPYSNYALLNSVGIAAGSAKAVLPIILMIIMHMIYILLQRSGLLVMIDVPYPPIEKEQALKELAEHMLLIRDGKESVIQEHGVVYKMSKELIAAAQIGDTKEEGDKIVERRKSIFGNTQLLISNASIVPDSEDYRKFEGNVTM
jgi:hypothetical protein